MKRAFYLFNPGRMSRKDNTLKFVAVDATGKESPPKYRPIETIESLYVFGSIDANSALFNFLGKQRISVHFFDYYEHYTGSFQPKDYLLAGKMQVAQTKTYLTSKKRLHIAKNLIEGASFNMLKNLRYYQAKREGIAPLIPKIEQHRSQLTAAQNVSQIMGLEGNCRRVYYQAFEHIITDFKMNGRHKQPPSNEVNALISFGNMMCYALALDMIYHTQLNPTISFLHEPGERRYSLALDLAEVFKPILVDRTIFKLLNRRMLKAQHFEQKLNACFLKDTGRKVFIKDFEERLKETIDHPSLKKKVSYKSLLKLECYKLSKYILGINEAYQPFKMRW